MRQQCTISDCTRPQKAQGYCASHYQRWRRGEDPGARPLGRPGRQALLPLDYAGDFRCRRCKEVKPHTAFAARAGRSCRKTICDACDQRASTERNLRDWYGLTQADYDAMREAQDGRCALCERKPPVRQYRSRTGEPYAALHVDHDHATGRVRGLLCASCNQVLERVDAIGLDVIARYLQPASG
jgi:hypothetical protein